MKLGTTLLRYFLTILLNIMFLHRWEDLPLFSTVVPSNICMFLPCKPFVVITTLSTGLVGVEVTSVLLFFNVLNIYYFITALRDDDFY